MTPEEIKAERDDRRRNYADGGIAFWASEIALQLATFNAKVEELDRHEQKRDMRLLPPDVIRALALAKRELNRVPAQGYSGWREAEKAVSDCLDVTRG